MQELRYGAILKISQFIILSQKERQHSKTILLSNPPWKKSDLSKNEIHFQGFKMLAAKVDNMHCRAEDLLM